MYSSSTLEQWFLQPYLLGVACHFWWMKCHNKLSLMQCKLCSYLLHGQPHAISKLHLFLLLGLIVKHGKCSKMGHHWNPKRIKNLDLIAANPKGFCKINKRGTTTIVFASIQSGNLRNNTFLSFLYLNKKIVVFFLLSCWQKLQAGKELIVMLIRVH